MKTNMFIFWISLLILFPHGLVSKSPTKDGQYSIDSENSNKDLEVDVRKDVALHESFRPRHKYKVNGHQTRFFRSDTDNKDLPAKTPHCAVMYKDNEPVGILQPFKESYRFLPINGDPTLVDINPIPIKRKTIMDVLYPNKINEDYNEEVAENTNQFADDRYPSIFAKFKIDSRLDKTLNPDLNLKRSMYKRDTEKPNVNSREMSPPKTSLSKTTGGNSAVVEEELKNILDDMGLIDDYGDREENKREISEDENLEQGTNKINLIKEDHNETRNKRGDVNGTTENGQSTTQITQSTMETTVVVPTKVQFEDEHTEEAESIDLFKADSAKLNEDSEKEDLDSSTETVLEELRKKRQFDASDSNNNEDKRDTTDTLTDINLKSTNLVKEAELNQYEKRVEREIRDKIQKLKEEVKEEIKNLKENPKMNDVESDTRRKKRQVVNTLIDEETQDIDPNFNIEEQHEGHVRRKRSSFDDNNTVNVSNTNYERNVEQKENLNYNNDIFGNKNSEIRNKTSFEDNYFSLTGKQNIDKKNDGLLFEINFGDIDPNINEKIKSNYLSEGNGHVIEKKEVNSSNNIFEMGSNLSKNRERTELKLPTLTYLKTFVNHTGKEKNLLNVINDIKYINENNYHTDIKNIRNNSCITCQTIPKHSNNATEQMDKSAEPLIQTDKNKQVVNNNGCNVTSEKKIPKTKRSVPPSRVKISVPKQFHGNNTLKPYLDKIMREIANTENVDSFEKEKRFLGVNPILENTTNRTDRYQESPLKKFSENTMKTILASHDNKTVDKNNTATLNDINPIVKDNSNPADHYRSRSLKQFNENGVKENPMNEIHVKVKKSGNQNGGIIENSSNNRINMRKTRQSKEDTEEHDYQYDDPRFSEEVVADNQTYDEQPYDSDDNVEDTSNLNSNCNCDKTDNNCKCGTQKADLSVPNIRQDYSDYMENSDKEVEKKSVKHCNCDKNGKHCKCQSLSEESQYIDNVEQQPSSIEKKSPDLYEGNAVDEFENDIEERVPRRPRQRSSMENSNLEHLSEDYNKNYETKSDKLTKRESEQNKVRDNQQFENGEYFVDLHPNIYRLTPVDTSREKRDNFKDVLAIHSGGPVMNHLVGIRQRSMLPHSRYRRRVQNDDNREPRQLIDMSDEDIFGALPQSFAGELARYKRVKRGKTKK